MRKIGLFGILLCINAKIFADPAFTGPILAPAGITVPKNHINFEIYGFYTNNYGFYDRHWKIKLSHADISYQINPIITFGLSDNIDLQFNLPYVVNKAYHKPTAHHIGDGAVTLGYQLLRQGSYLFLPNLRITYQLNFPTGRYENLNTVNAGSDSTGNGSYQSIGALNFQHLLALRYDTYLRTRLSLSAMHTSKVSVFGPNAYGGNINTFGQVKPSRVVSIDWAEEFSLNPNWVLVFEAYYFTRGPTTFTGFSDVYNIGFLDQKELSYAPAIEYNFNQNVGIIVGSWFSGKGKNYSAFKSAVAALNVYW